MPTKRLDRLMFVQGGACFFCKLALPKSQASIEHLFASANGGGNNEENCVACCKGLNAILGSMSLKDKFQVVLNQRGSFTCPSAAGATTMIVPAKCAPLPVAGSKALPIPASNAPAAAKLDHFALAVANLMQRGIAKPKTLKALSATVATIFSNGLTPTELAALLQRLQASGKVIIAEDKISYAL